MYEELGTMVLWGLNHNVNRLVSELTEVIYELDTDRLKDMTLAEIRGVIDLADALKEVLKQ